MATNKNYRPPYRAVHPAEIKEGYQSLHYYLENG